MICRHLRLRKQVLSTGRGIEQPDDHQHGRCEQDQAVAVAFRRPGPCCGLAELLPKSCFPSVVEISGTSSAAPYATTITRPARERIA